MSLTPDQKALVRAAEETCSQLYEGRVTPHRSCGIALAETFGVPTPAYQSLRRGGITGCGECGAVVAGRLILGERLGDSDPTGPVTPSLRAAMLEYERLWQASLDRGEAPGGDIVCNHLTGQFETFRSKERADFCTKVAATAAAACAEALLAHGGHLSITPISELTVAASDDA